MASHKTQNIDDDRPPRSPPRCRGYTGEYADAYFQVEASKRANSETGIVYHVTSLINSCVEPGYTVSCPGCQSVSGRDWLCRNLAVNTGPEFSRREPTLAMSTSKSFRERRRSKKINGRRVQLADRPISAVNGTTTRLFSIRSHLVAHTRERGLLPLSGFVSHLLFDTLSAATHVAFPMPGIAARTSGGRPLRPR